MDVLSSSSQLMEVSQLLQLYQARGWGALPAEDLLLYLKRLENGGYSLGGRRRDLGVESALGRWIRPGAECSGGIVF